MGFWDAIAGIIPGVGSAVGAAIGEAQSDKHVKDAQNFSLMQGDIAWQRQRDAFNMANKREDEVWNRQNEYNMGLWNLQNAYNSPAAQMQRYKEAGLNPHLIYGQSNTGGSIASATLGSGSISGTGSANVSQRQNLNWQSVFEGLGNSLMNYMAFRQQGAQTDNVKANTEVAKQQAANLALDGVLKVLQTEGVVSDNFRKTIENHYLPTLMGFQVDAAKQGIESTNQAMAIRADENNRANTKMAADLYYRYAENARANKQFELAAKYQKLGYEMDVQKANMSLAETWEKILESRGKRITEQQKQQLNELEIKAKAIGPDGYNMLWRMLGKGLLDVDSTYRKGYIPFLGMPEESIQDRFNKIK